jgi:hypothetical protein
MVGRPVYLVAGREGRARPTSSCDGAPARQVAWASCHRPPKASFRSRTSPIGEPGEAGHDSFNQLGRKMVSEEIQGLGEEGLDLTRLKPHLAQRG